MKKTLYTVCALLIMATGLFLRFKDYTHRAPFDWDQNRDYTEIARIASGKYTLIGPVAKGEGGFFLGPLYYYIETPFFLVSHGNPASLPLVSIFCDMLAIVAILYLLPERMGKLGALAVAAIWSVSWFAIENAHIAWNVSLIPLWTILFLYFASAPKKLTSPEMLAFGIVTGLTWHVHASLIPLALFLCILRWRDIISFKHLLLFFVGYGITLVPLAIFDLRHGGMQRYLMMQYVSVSQTVKGDWITVIQSVISRLGKNTYSILFVASDLHPLWGIITIVLGVIGIIQKSPLARAAGWMVVVNVLLTISLREPGLPEYYMAASYIPTLILIVCALALIKPYRIPLVSFATIILVFINLRAFTTTPTAFSLSQKMAIANHIVTESRVVSLHTDLPFGRDSGISSLIHVYGGTIREDAKPSFLISDKSDEQIFYNGELYETEKWYGGFRLAKHN